MENSVYWATSETFTFHTKRRLEFINITQVVEDFIERSGIETGTITIQTHHTTCSLWVNEDEKNLIGPASALEGAMPDLARVLDRFADPGDHYGHNDICDASNPTGRRNTHLCAPDENGVVHECINGHAHAQGMILQSSITLVIREAKLCRGRWQEVLLVELDHDRERQVTLLAQGLRPHGRSQ